MKLTDLDYYATYGNTFLHKIKAKNKLIIALIIIISALYFNNIFFVSVLYVFLILIMLYSGLPRVKFLASSFYPLIFMLIYLYSMDNLSYLTALNLILKVLCISSTFMFIIFSTQYIEIFKALSFILPSIMLNILFNTYRAIFIMNKTLENLLTTIRLRGKLNIFRPIIAIKAIGNLIGFFVIKSIETSEKMYEGLKLRGYTDKLTFLKD